MKEAKKVGSHYQNRILEYSKQNWNRQRPNRKTTESFKSEKRVINLRIPSVEKGDKGTKVKKEEDIKSKGSKQVSNS